MVDTMMIKMIVKKSVSNLFEQVNEYLESQGLGKLHKDNRTENWRYYTERLNRRGFLELGFNKPNRQYFFEIKLQPIRLLKENEFVELSKFEQYFEIENQFNLYLGEILGYETELPEYLKLRNWKVSRIDYACNYYTSYVDKYLKLLNHGKVPRNFTKHDYRDSFYLTLGRANFNFYDKYAELQNKKYLKSEDIEKAKNILRFEIQCKNKDIQRLKNKFGLESSKVIEFWDARIAEYVLKNRIKSVFGEYDFYKFDTAKKKISQCSKNNIPLILVIDNIARSSNLAEAKENFLARHKKISPNKYDKFLTKIRKLEINPITLDNSDTLEMLPNPHSYINIENLSR